MRKFRHAGIIAATASSIKYVLGVDEAGRGPLAGPVTVAGVFLPVKVAARILRGIRDSKKLTPKAREAWYGILTNDARIQWAVAHISPKVIDRVNIRQAANRGARRVVAKILKNNGTISMSRVAVFLDGGLGLSLHIPHTAVIKGDELIPAVSAASVIAKVTRDRTMLRLHRKYPHYRFDLHKGYGTALHRRLIAEFGRSPAHRATFRLLVDRHIELGII